MRMSESPEFEGANLSPDPTPSLPSSNLMSAGATLHVIEAQRVISILQETREKLSFLGSITPDVLQHRDELSQIVGDEISRIIQEQRDLEARYEKLITERSVLKGLANKSQFKENQREIQAVSRALRESTKNLCHNLRDNPNVGGNLLKIQDERQHLMELLGTTVNEVRDQGLFGFLVSRVKEAKEKQEQVQEIVSKEKKATESVKQLEIELNHEKLEHHREVTEQKTLITSLKEELLHLKGKAQIDLKYATKEAKAKTSSTKRLYTQIVLEQEEKIDDLTRSCETEKRVHEESVRYLSETYEKLSKQCADWNEKYSKEIEEKDLEYEALKQKRELNLEKLDRLKNRWEEEKQMKAAKETERERLLELEELRKEEEFNQNENAIVIQRCFRNYFERLLERRKKQEQEKKSKKGGKGKGGKGKKGKK